MPKVRARVVGVIYSIILTGDLALLLLWFWPMWEDPIIVGGIAVILGGLVVVSCKIHEEAQ